MAVSNTTVKQIYNGNDSTVTFAIPFTLLTNTQVKVILVSSTGVETTQTLTTHYSISGSNVVMVTAPATGEKLIIIRETALTQPTDYIANGPFPAEDHEDALDRGLMQVQELDERLDRAPTFKKSSGVSNLEMATPVADQMLVYNSGATGIESLARAAANISYDNTSSGLTASDVQAAIDEIDTAEGINATNIAALDVRVSTAESNISTLQSDLSTAEADIVALEGRMGTAETNITNNAGNLSAHIADTTDAHDASAISIDPSGMSIVTATDMQSAIAELDAVSPGTASGTVFTPSADVLSTNVQDAIDEVRGYIPEDASDVAFTSVGSIVATDVAAALDEVHGDIITDHGGLSGLTDDDHSQYTLLAGRSGGQVIQGGTGASENLELESTANATKGFVGVKDNTLKIGDGADTTKEIEARNGGANPPKVRYNSSTNTWQFTNDGVIYKDFGSGSGAGINYCLNGDAETNSTDGWATYADAAGTSPVDGTGGTANITWTTSSTSPLIGDFSFVYTKDSVNRQGQGASYDFTIDAAFKNSPMYVSMNYEPSANFVSDDIKVFMYCVDSSTLIQLTSNSTVGGGKKYTGVFFTDSNTNYRLIIHQSSTSALAYTIKFDAIVITPQAIVDAPIITSGSYTPTITHDSGEVTNFTPICKWQRVNNEIILDFTGLFSATSAAFSALYFSLPSGLSIDWNALSNPTSMAIGDGSCPDTGATNYKVSGIIATALGNKVAVRYHFIGAHTGTVPVQLADISNTVPFTFDNTDRIQLKNVKIPILEWVNQTAMLSTNEMLNVTTKVDAYLTANQTGINPSASAVKINVNGVISQTGSEFSTSDYRFTAAKSGYYGGTGFVYVGGTNVLANEYLLAIYKNGTAIRYSQTHNALASVAFRISLPFGPVYLAKGDYLELYLFGVGDNSTNTLTVLGGASITGISIYEIPDFSVYGVYGNLEIKTATSSPFNLATSGFVSGECPAFTGNSIVLSPGKYRLFGTMRLIGAVFGINELLVYFSTSNGDNTTTIPTAYIPTLADHGSSVLMETSDNNIFERATIHVFGITEITSTTTLYLVCRTAFTSTASGTLTANITAERIQ